jgi:hypothetical protein
MIDLRYKTEYDKIIKKDRERLDKLSTEFDIFVTKMVKKYKILSIELMALLNNQIANEINCRFTQIADQKTKKQLLTKDQNKIMIKKN